MTLLGVNPEEEINMENENYLEKRIIAIDAQNVAFWPCKDNKPKDWRLVLQVAKFYHDLGHKVAVFVPIHFWIPGKGKSIPEDIRSELKKYADVHREDCGKDPERDDKMMIAFSYIMDAYYVSNDKGMCSHFKLNTLGNRTWCNSRRIEFTFDADGKFSPGLKIDSIYGETNDSPENSIAEKEVRT